MEFSRVLFRSRSRALVAGGVGEGDGKARAGVGGHGQVRDDEVGADGDVRGVEVVALLRLRDRIVAVGFREQIVGARGGSPPGSETYPSPIPPPGPEGPPRATSPN